MKVATTLEAELRDATGKGPARQARRDGKIPVNLYSKSGTPVNLAVDHNTLTQEYRKGGFMHKIVAIKAGGKTYHTIPREVQFHPVTDLIEHMDFQSVKAGEEIKVAVPVKISGTEKSPGIKRGGVLNVARHSIEFYTTPEKIPDQINVDVSTLEIGHSIHISAVTLPEGVKPVIADRDFTIASVAGRGKSEEETPAAAAAAATVEGGAAAPAAAGAAAPAAGGDKGKK